MPDKAPAFKGYRIYPRGFLGASLGEQIKPSERPSAAGLKTHQYHPDWFKPNMTVVEHNRNIEDIWRRLHESHAAIDHMDFRDQILLVAKSAFGTQDFLEWVLIQQQGPSTGDIHMDFLRDTLTFIMTGRRGINLHAWTSMLSDAEVRRSVTKTDGSMTWFFIDEAGRQRNVMMDDVLQRWCSHPSGFADLAQTLHVLFGEIQG